MPVGLNLVEKVEERLLADGLLPADVSVVHRVIDFSRGDFTLRWASAETAEEIISVRIVQQLAQRSLGRPVLLWEVAIDGHEEANQSGRTLLTETRQYRGLAGEIAEGCRRALAFLPQASTRDGISASQPDSSVQ